MRPEITAEMVRRFFDYNPETGDLIWRPRDSSEFSRLSSARTWNTRFAGKVAGHRADYTRVGLLQWSWPAHSLIWLHVHGVYAEEIDHINHDKYDNRIVNLRACTRLENVRNFSLSKVSPCGVSGLSPYRGKWIVRIGMGRSQPSYLGIFSDFFEAICVRKSAEAQLGYHPNHGAPR